MEPSKSEKLVEVSKLQIDKKIWRAINHISQTLRNQDPHQLFELYRLIATVDAQ
jgi:predicted Zn-ribbon and HTH transcriptional regulator